MNFDFRFLERLVSTLEEKKQREVKLKEGLKELAAKRMELQNSLASFWPKQVSSLPFNLFMYFSSVQFFFLFYSKF